MGKSLDQLEGLGDGPGKRDELAIARRRAEKLLLEVREMLASGDYDFAWGYLQDLARTLEQTERCTDAQEQAVRNIKLGQERQESQREGWERHERRTGRRYEGFDGRYK